MNLTSAKTQKKWEKYHGNPTGHEERLVLALRYVENNFCSILRQYVAFILNRPTYTYISSTAASFRHLAFEFRMGDSTLSLVLKETVQILRYVLQSLNMPQPTVEKFKKTAAKYVYYSILNFPQCLGAIDGKYVRIICPAHADTKYFNCKSYYSILGTAVAQWLRCCATNRKVAGSIPDGVIGIFH